MKSLRRAAEINLPILTRSVSEGPNKNPSLTFRVGMFIPAARLRASGTGNLPVRIKRQENRERLRIFLSLATYSD